MQTEEKQAVLDLVAEAHSRVEQAYLENLAAKGTPAYTQKRRLLLADLSLHLVQAALKGDELSKKHLQRSLFSVLTISDEFIPEAGLKETAQRLVNETETNTAGT